MSVAALVALLVTLAVHAYSSKYHLLTSLLVMHVKVVRLRVRSARQWHRVQALFATRHLHRNSTALTLARVKPCLLHSITAYSNV